jgi:hypothetical protein
MQISCPPEEFDLPEPPPIDDDGEDGATEPSAEEMGEFGSILEGIDDEQVDLDDDSASDLDIGIDVLKPADEGEEVGPELIVDIAGMLATVDEDEESVTAPDAGPSDLDASVGLADLPDEGLAGEDEEFDEAADPPSDDLPDLDADAEGEFELEDAFDLEWVDDEPPPPPLGEPWQETVWHADEAFGAVAVHSGTVVAGGVDILWIECGSLTPIRLAAIGSSIVSMALLEAELDVVVFATVSGQLARRHRRSHQSELLDSWRHASHTTPHQAVTLELVSIERPQGGELLLARCSNGSLILSRDLGSSWTSIELESPVSALASGGSAACALARGARPELWYSDDGAARFIALRPDETALRVASGESPLVAVHDDVVALADPVRGLAVSIDRGSSFARISGCAGATALTAARFGDRSVIWAALYRPAHGCTEIVLIQTPSRTAQRVATLRSDPASPVDDEAAERYVVETLRWDSSANRLWAVGAFGLLSWSPQSPRE